MITLCPPARPSSQSSVHQPVHASVRPSVEWCVVRSVCSSDGGGAATTEGERDGGGDPPPSFFLLPRLPSSSSPHAEFAAVLQEGQGRGRGGDDAVCGTLSYSLAPDSALHCNAHTLSLSHTHSLSLTLPLDLCMYVALVLLEDCGGLLVLRFCRS